jgi:hypothetical protein
LRAFRNDEFGTGAESPTQGHIEAVNDLIRVLRDRLLRRAREVGAASRAATSDPTTAKLQRLLTLKERGHDLVRATEKVWDFYFELFGQRQSRYGDWLVSCDRIALDCYQAAYTSIGVAKSIPAPAPFAYMRTGFSPATFRRGIALTRLGKQLNPFPLIQLPYHRLVNPWTLGAVLHEVSHNLQNELGIQREVPRRIGVALLDQGISKGVAATWVRWNRELFADLSGLLLGGPAVVASLMDVVGRGPEAVVTYSPTGPHPTPYLRTLLSIELLRRMGFQEEAERYRRAWTRLYPDPHTGTLPDGLIRSFPAVCEIVVDAVCFRPYAELGNRAYAQCVRFGPKEQQMVEETAQRLAAGNDPGIIPERYVIAASRVALDRKLARPGVISANFYRHLSRR